MYLNTQPRQPSGLYCRKTQRLVHSKIKRVDYRRSGVVPQQPHFFSGDSRNAAEQITKQILKA